ncbi:MAG: protein kinase [Sandaracinaceae bacterium]|nr:protein kinase [Sandaracinaceae bacterium]
MGADGEDETFVAEPGDTADTSGFRRGDLVAGRYEIDGVVGRGGMGCVYRVHDKKLDEVVALKLLTYVSDKAYERFLREVRVARRVTHPNVARTHDLGEHGGIPFLTMELVVGEPLDDIIEARGPLRSEEVKRIGAGIAAGLQAAHAAGVIHRDLKPANVLVAEGGRAVLTDFGIARMAMGDGKQTAGLVGTPHYMSPEQVSGQATDARSDVYALGIILFEMATRALPFGGDTPLSIAVARLTVPPSDPRELAAVPDDLATLILSCLAQDPARRPRSAEEVREALVGRSRPGSTTPPSLYAPIELGARALAILPFVYRGAAEHDYLGEGLAEELVDVLSQTRGLKVIALGATRRFAEDRDPKRVHVELGADVVVDGTVQLGGDRVRLSARLVEPSGVQLWSERFDGRFEDVFALQESMGRRVAEALRLELTAAAHRHSAPPEALELYLRARREQRGDIMFEAESSLAKLDRALELAPDFAHAKAAHAITSIRAWWTMETVDVSRSGRAHASVARALAEAPELAETHLARGMLALQEGRFREAAEACAEALTIAPTMPEAHQYLGTLQTEAGRPREGRERLELTLELDPTLNICHLALGRLAALWGDWEAMRRHETALVEAFPKPTLPLLSTRMRWSLYAGDLDLARHHYEGIVGLGTMPGEQLGLLYGFALGERTIEDAKTTFGGLRDWTPNRRFGSLMLQLLTEAFATGGAPELALETLREAADGYLIDLEWVRRCPLLDPLRAQPAFDEAAAIVERRANDIWRR